jgi:hypothetical protein
MADDPGRRLSPTRGLPWASLCHPVGADVSIKQLQEVHARCHLAASLPKSDIESQSSTAYDEDCANDTGTNH